MTATRLSEEGAVELLTELVGIPSVSGAESRASEFLTARMQALGFTRAYVDEAGNAVGVMGSGPRQLVLLGHIDTVPGEIPVRREDGGDLLYGRGAVDAKGPLAAFTSAVARLGERAGWSVAVVGAVEEEAPTSKGARFAAGCFAPEACVIGEPSGWDALTLGYKGRTFLEYRLVQALAHSAGPERAPAELGVDFWNAVAAETAEFNRGRDALFEQVLPSLLEFRTQSDGLHQEVRLDVSLRTPPGFDDRAWSARLSQLAGEADLALRESVPAWRADRRTPLVRAFLPAIRAEGGHPAFKLKTGTSDMNVVGPAWRCPILAYGPGDSRLDHTPNEHLSLAEYARAIRVLEAALSALTGLE